VVAKPTIDEVARLAGVSTSTVSRSLSGAGRVGAETTRRVKKVAQQLGYAVSPSASRLATGRTDSIAVVMPFIDRWFFAEILAGIEVALRGTGHDLLLYNVKDTESRKEYFSSGLLRKRVDGVVLVTLAVTKPEVRALRALSIPVGIVGARVNGFHSVLINDREAAAGAVRHLINLGHERIAIISSDPDREMHFTVPVERRAGYLDALRAAGITPDPQLEVHADYGVEGGEKATTQLLGGSSLPTAVFAESDELAFGALRAFRRFGIQVPEEISVVGFDNHPMAEYFDLTTVAQQVRAQGLNIACQVLDALVSPAKRGASQLEAVTELVARATTSVPRPKARPRRGKDHK